jgi:hypothetical protein
VITLKVVGSVLVFVAVFFDLQSYWKQISKTIRTKHSGQVSSSAYMAKIAHYLCSIVSLAIFSNWVGFGMEGAAFIFCLVTFALVIKYKPKGWKLIDVEFDVKRKRRSLWKRALQLF